MQEDKDEPQKPRSISRQAILPQARAARTPAMYPPPEESEARTQHGAAGWGGPGRWGALHTRPDRSQAEDARPAGEGVRQQTPGAGGYRELGQAGKNAQLRGTLHAEDTRWPGQCPQTPATPAAS